MYFFLLIMKEQSCTNENIDDRLVIKEMMNAWNVAEKDAFLKFAPKYFEHMKRSANVTFKKRE